MNKSIIIVILFLLGFSCADNNNMENSDEKIYNLRKENDSLKEILAEINTKYVFDSISVRKIYDHSNTYEPNSELRTEFVIAAFSQNKTYFIEYDSIIDEVKVNPRIIYPNVNAGFNVSAILKKNNHLYHDLILENNYGIKDTLEILNVIN